MKQIKAFIRPHCRDCVLDALFTHPSVTGVTISTVEGFGRTVGRKNQSQNEGNSYSTVEVVKLECIVNDKHLDEILNVIQTNTHTGNPGDGRISVSEILQVIQIRTGEQVGDVKS